MMNQSYKEPRPRSDSGFFHAMKKGVSTGLALSKSAPVVEHAHPLMRVYHNGEEHGIRQCKPPGALHGRED